MRNAVSIVAAALAIAGALLLATSIWPLGLWSLAMAALLAVGVVWERWRYRPILDAPPRGPDWRGTSERFVDPQSGRTVTVYHNAGSGERAYVAGPDAGCATVRPSLR